MTPKDLSPKNDYYRFFLSKLWFEIGNTEELFRILDNGQKADIPEFEDLDDSDSYRNTLNPRGKIIRDLIWKDLNLWSYWGGKREWITWNNDGTTTHEWEDSCCQGPADLFWFLGIQSHCVYDNCTIRIYIGDSDRGLLCIIYRNYNKIEFCQFTTDDGNYYSSWNIKWPSKIFIQFKVALMSEISELKIPGFNHQIVQEYLFNLTEFNFTKEYI